MTDSLAVPQAISAEVAGTRSNQNSSATDNPNGGRKETAPN
jgi:hypothetical protein